MNLQFKTLSVLSTLIFSTFVFANSEKFAFRDGEKVAFIGGSLAERMNLYGHLETSWHVAFPEKKLRIRNFGWPADEVGIQQRPSNYTRLDDPLKVFSPTTFICFFGFNEHFAGDQPNSLAQFKKQYRRWIEKARDDFQQKDITPKFVLVSPIAFESSGLPNQANAGERNKILESYCNSIRELAAADNHVFVDLFSKTKECFSETPGLQFTVNGIHMNESGDRVLAKQMNKQLLGFSVTRSSDSVYERIRSVVNDKSWLHLQDYRMLNGWYVYGGRRTFDTETYPTEFRKIRSMVSVRDRYIWDLAAGKPVPSAPDDSKTGEVFTPETMFGSRDQNFREFREPETLVYPTPEISIQKMTVPDGLEVQLFASEREFPELANPTQIAFDDKGRLWVSCMVNYPQWLPGSAKPSDKLLIFEDTDKDGRADICKTFYDKLICPTGFEFHKDGVLVVDEPRILYLKDVDHDDKADEVIQVIDGIATDDTHHAMGAWEWSHGGRLFMLEGISMSTTIETPFGPVRSKGPSGAYVLDPLSWKIEHFRTPGYGNPWCLVFDRWGMGMIGDGTGAQQHWTSPWSGSPVKSRATMRTNFDNENMRPAVGNEFLLSRHLPEDLQGQFTYACVINMHGFPSFKFGDEDGTAGYAGSRVEDLLSSTDNFFRPVDPKIGPDGALWFGDWCNALIGHMQYSQRDPNRDHEHGRIYRLVNRNKQLIEPETQFGQSTKTILEQLLSYELRTRYRARRELRSRDKIEVLAALEQWIGDTDEGERLCEALWIQESFREIDPHLVSKLLAHKDFHVRAAAVHSVTNERERFKGIIDVLKTGVSDRHPRVRLESLRGLSYLNTAEAAELAMSVVDQPMDYWLEYTLDHTIQALSRWTKKPQDLTRSSEKAKEYLHDYIIRTTPGGYAIEPLKIAQDDEASMTERLKAVMQLAGLPGQNARNGKAIFERTCSGCHQIRRKGNAFGPSLDGLANRYSKPEIIRHVLWPNEKIAKGYETKQVLTLDGVVLSGFVLDETDETISLGVATDDGKGKRVDVNREDIDEIKSMKSSSMPEGLMLTVAPTEFLDLMQFLIGLNSDEDGWTPTIANEIPPRRDGKLVEVSSPAWLRYPFNCLDRWNAGHLEVLSSEKAKNREFAFHSPLPPIDSPHVEIKLKQPTKIGKIFIENRRNESLLDRADGLTIWLSNDGERWQKLWQTPKAAQTHTVELNKKETAQFLKIGLPRKGILHLNQISVYGIIE